MVEKVRLGETSEAARDRQWVQMKGRTVDAVDERTAASCKIERIRAMLLDEDCDIVRIGSEIRGLNLGLRLEVLNLDKAVGTKEGEATRLPILFALPAKKT